MVRTHIRTYVCICNVCNISKGWLQLNLFYCNKILLPLIRTKNKCATHICINTALLLSVSNNHCPLTPGLLYAAVGFVEKKSLFLMVNS